MARWKSSTWPLYSTSASAPSPPHLFGERDGGCASRPVTPAQSCYLTAVAACGTATQEIGWPGALSELRVARRSAETPVHLAPPDVGALALCRLEVFNRKTVMSWLVPASPARWSSVSVENYRLRQHKWRSAGQWTVAILSTLAWASAAPRFRKLLRALFEHGVIKFRKTARHHCGVFAVWKKNRDQRLVINSDIPHTAFEAADPVALATGQSFSRVNVETNDPIYVSGVDIQVAFYSLGLPELFQDMFALDPVEAW